MRSLWPLLLTALGPAAALRRAPAAIGEPPGARGGAAVLRDDSASRHVEDPLSVQPPRQHLHLEGALDGRNDSVSSLYQVTTEGNLSIASNSSAWPVVLPLATQSHLAWRTCRQMILPVVVLALGGLTSIAGKSMRTLSQLLLFFGAQTFMNLYMKAVLSMSIVQEVPRMAGFQAPLLLTAVQQLISFAVLVVALAVLGVCGFGYRPRVVQTAQEWFMILFLAACFAANIALNNFSLSLIDMSASLMIRSTSPVSALLLQLLFRRWFQEALDQLSVPKMFFLFCGIACAVLVVLSKSHNSGVKEFSELYALGIVLCIGSVVSSSMELILVVIIGKTVKLNPIETILYMSLPVVAFLVAPSFCLRHAVAYEAHPPSTDWNIFLEVWRLSPSTTVLVFLSGLFALGYNVLLYAVVSDLSPFYTSFAANFNKVGAIAVAVLFGFEHLPAKPWNYVMVLAVLGNMFAFRAYSAWREPEAKKP